MKKNYTISLLLLSFFTFAQAQKTTTSGVNIVQEGEIIVFKGGGSTVGNSIRTEGGISKTSFSRSLAGKFNSPNDVRVIADAAGNRIWVLCDGTIVKIEPAGGGLNKYDTESYSSPKPIVPSREPVAPVVKDVIISEIPSTYTEKSIEKEVVQDIPASVITEESIIITKDDVGDVSELFEKNYEEMTKKEQREYKNNEKKIMKKLERELKELEKNNK